jgi:hypothetical protein
MSDELPPAPSESTEDATKAETIRITLPPKPEQPTAKRETVRINLPGKPAPTPPAGSPKKETTKIPPIESAATQVISTPAPPPAPGSAGKPFVPPPPKPPAPVGSGTLKPVSGVNPPPKPPSLGAKPTVPLKPAPAPSSVAKPAPATSTSSGVEPVTQKAAAPKKETARITLPPEGGKPALPKATIKMQQTQPLVKQPVTSATSQALQPAVALTAMANVPDAEPDGTVNILAIAALVLSLISLGLVFWAFSASSIS